MQAIPPKVTIYKVGMQGLDGLGKQRILNLKYIATWVLVGCNV